MWYVEHYSVIWEYIALLFLSGIVHNLTFQRAFKTKWKKFISFNKNHKAGLLKKRPNSAQWSGKELYLTCTDLICEQILLIIVETAAKQQDALTEEQTRSLFQFSITMAYKGL